MKKYFAVTMHVILSFFFFSSFAQDLVIVYDTPGKVEVRHQQIVKGFNAAGIFPIVNKIPVVNKPVGYDVLEGEATFNDANEPIHGRVSIGFPRHLRFKGKMERQGEFAQVGFILNRLSPLMRESYFMGEDVDKAKLPTMFSDTVTFEREVRNGQEVWVSSNQPVYEERLIMINPRNQARFVPVTKEQIAELWISKLGLEANKYQQLVKDNKAYLAEQQGKTGDDQLIKNLEDGIRQYNLWLDYIVPKKKAYEQKLAGLTAAEKKEAAEIAVPVTLAVQAVKGKQVEKVTGDMFYEWVDMMSGGAKNKQKVFVYNPDFFDRKLPRTAIQLMVIKGSFRIKSDYSTDKKMKDMLDKDFFPLLDYKALASLMYK